jgi:hypothetical protein
MLLHGLALVAGGRPSAFGGFARSVSGRSYCQCTYPIASGVVVLGLDLARARGVVVRGLGESFVVPQCMSTKMTHSRVMHLLGGVAARPSLLWILKFCSTAGPSSSSP